MLSHTPSALGPPASTTTTGSNTQVDKQQRYKNMSVIQLYNFLRIDTFTKTYSKFGKKREPTGIFYRELVATFPFTVKMLKRR